MNESHPLRYLLLQVRDADDPMRPQEVRCFARALACPLQAIRPCDLLAGTPSPELVQWADVVLIGGAGNYSVAEGGPWLGPALKTMEMLYEQGKPTFASCWGFQAFSKALGGRVVTDLARAELGTLQVRLTPAGRQDPVFGSLGSTFDALMGHQDIVDRLPDGALLLASTDRVENQAFCFPGKPIYCTQFHPELNREAFIQRVEAYPEYVERIIGLPLDQFIPTCRETPETAALLPRFIRHVTNNRPPRRP